MKKKIILTLSLVFLLIFTMCISSSATGTGYNQSFTETFTWFIPDDIPRFSTADCTSNYKQFLTVFEQYIEFYEIEKWAIINPTNDWDDFSIWVLEVEYYRGQTNLTSENVYEQDNHPPIDSEDDWVIEYWTGDADYYAYGLGTYYVETTTMFVNTESIGTWKHINHSMGFIVY